MGDISVVWIVVGLAVLVLGPAGGVWAGIKGSVFRIEQQMTTFIAQVQSDHHETQEWLKGLEERTAKNTTEIAVLDERTKGVV